MTTERQNSLAVSKLYPNHYNQNNVENRASYYEFGLLTPSNNADIKVGLPKLCLLII